MGLTLGGGTLYFGDVNDPDKAVSVKEATMDECAKDDMPIMTHIDTDRSFTITMETKVNRNVWLSLLYGRKITNN